MGINSKSRSKLSGQRCSPLGQAEGFWWGLCCPLPSAGGGCLRSSGGGGGGNVGGFSWTRAPGLGKTLFSPPSGLPFLVFSLSLSIGTTGGGADGASVGANSVQNKPHTSSHWAPRLCGIRQPNTGCSQGTHCLPRGTVLRSKRRHLNGSSGSSPSWRLSSSSNSARKRSIAAARAGATHERGLRRHDSGIGTESTQRVMMSITKNVSLQDLWHDMKASTGIKYKYKLIMWIFRVCIVRKIFLHLLI